MKIICQKDLLVEAVSNTARATCAKSPVAALEGLLLKAQEGQLQLTGYDLELGIMTNVEAKTEQEGELVLSAKLLLDIIRRIPGETVNIASDDKHLATIRGGASEFTIPGLSPEEYPELPNVETQADLVLKQGVLKSMIDQTLFAVATTDSKPVHTGSLFNIKDSCVTLVSVDGYRLAIREENAPCEGKMSFVVPGKTLGEVLKLLRDDDTPAELRVGRRHIQIQIDSYCVTSRLLEGEFLDYRAAIPRESTTEILVNTREFIGSVERVSLLITDRLKSPLRCRFEDGEIRLSCSTAIGRATDQFAAAITGAPVEMGFNNRYLLDALRNSEGDEVKIQLGGPLSPMKVLPKEGADYLFLVLPVRLKTE